MSLSDAQLERYSRHIILKEIGGYGQARLLASRVVVVGAGGIGSPAIQYLAGAGIGTLVLIDDDRVELSNLQRQTLFGAADLGRYKVDAASDAVARLNPDVVVETHHHRLADTAADLIVGADAVLDGTDNFATRLAIADAALARQVPLISAAVAGFEGQLGVYSGWENDKPCYRCFVGPDPERPDATCADQGVLGALTGVVGGLAALETIRSIVPFGDDSVGKLLLIDALGLRFRSIALPKDPGCPACGAAGSAEK